MQTCHLQNAPSGKHKRKLKPQDAAVPDSLHGERLLPDTTGIKRVAGRGQPSAGPPAQLQHMHKGAQGKERLLGEITRLVGFEGRFNSDLDFSSLPPSVCCFYTSLFPFWLFFQVCAAAVHSVLHPRSGDDYSLRSDLQRALPWHSV